MPDAIAARENLGTNWAEISQPIEGDPDKFLRYLLSKTSGAVSEPEAKWKAVLSNIFDKSREQESFFTEQEEVFIKTMMAVQNEGGKVYGITSA